MGVIALEKHPYQAKHVMNMVKSQEKYLKKRKGGEIGK